MSAGIVRGGAAGRTAVLRDADGELVLVVSSPDAIAGRRGTGPLWVAEPDRIVAAGRCPEGAAETRLSECSGCHWRVIARNEEAWIAELPVSAPRLRRSRRLQVSVRHLDVIGRPLHRERLDVELVRAGALARLSSRWALWRRRPRGVEAEFETG